MSENMESEESFVEHHVKLYQIDLKHFELRDFDNHFDIIEFITRKHKEQIQDFEGLKKSIWLSRVGRMDFYFYKYDERDKTSPWGGFLPKELTEGEDFSVQSMSFVLFCSTENHLYCIIGGRGIAVIKRWINQIFGIEVFEKIAAPEQDVVTKISSRGISGNLNSRTVAFRKEQKLIDSLSLTSLPVRATIQVREELLRSVFSFLALHSQEKVFLEIGSSFFIKRKLNFEQAYRLIEVVDDIFEMREYTSLSAFERFRDNTLVEDNLRKLLYRELRDDMMRTVPAGRSIDDSRFDFDFIHPSKLEKFYECDRYELYARSFALPFFSSDDKNTLYQATLNYVYENSKERTLGEFGYIISGIRVYGYRGEEHMTHAMFTDHITCETRFNNSPIFKIDSRWYKVKGDFIDRVNRQCLNMIKANQWVNHPLKHRWDLKSMTEGKYNLKYENEDNFLVLDKCLGQNIELCDLLYSEENTTYLIHVKAGFDAKIRDLSNQVSIASNRMWDDVKSGRYEFIDEVMSSYIKKNRSRAIDKQSFRAFFDKDIVFVMAFAPKIARGKTVINNLDEIKSNIAKFSLIQAVREINTERSRLYIVEIEKP